MPKIHLNKIAILSILLLGSYAQQVCGQGYSLQFNGTGYGDMDRVKIPLLPAKPVNVSLDFTIEWWMRALPGQNPATICDGSNWYFAHILIDRDIFGGGDYGDYGVALGNRRIMVGVETDQSSFTSGICGTTIVDDGQWHHIAVTRKASNGSVKLYVDGLLDASLNSSPSTGNISYRESRSTAYPNSDPFLVLGAEKHDYPGSLYYKGWIDELRISDTLRYTGTFSPSTLAFISDSRTRALYHFDEGAGNLVHDASSHPNGPSHGERKPAPGAYPLWSNMTPIQTPSIFLTIRCFIEGYMNANEMRPVLLNQGVSTTATVCDSLMIGLMSPLPPYTLLWEDTTTVNTQGWASLPIPTLLNGQSVYLRFRHRNALETWTSTTVTLANDTLDMSQSPGMAFGMNLKQVSPGLYAFYSGDVVKDIAYAIDLLDLGRLEFDTAQFLTGYQASDLTGDGNVDLLDLLPLEQNLNQFIFTSKPE